MLINEDFSKIPVPQPIFHKQYAHRILAHGKLCQWCKSSVILYKNAVLVYRIAIPRQKDRKYPAKLYFHKDNWDWVCGEDCANEMMARWSDAPIAVAKLAEKIGQSKPIRTPGARKGEEYEYRGLILRMAGIDPKVYTEDVLNPVLHPFPIDRFFT